MIIFEKLFLFEEEIIIRSICKFSTYLREVTVRYDGLITIDGSWILIDFGNVIEEVMKLDGNGARNGKRN